MNLFQLILKQMRQRALGTWLTLLSVLLGMALAIAILLFQRGSASLFGQTDYGFDVLVGSSKGSPLQLVLNTVYHLDKSPGRGPVRGVRAAQRQEAAAAGTVRLSRSGEARGPVHGRRHLQGPPDRRDDAADVRRRRRRPADRSRPDLRHPSDAIFQYRPDRRVRVGRGPGFRREEVRGRHRQRGGARPKVKLGDKFKATHGSPGPNEIPDEHDEQWQVVGVLKPTGTATDRVPVYPPDQRVHDRGA